MIIESHKLDNLHFNKMSVHSYLHGVSRHDSDESIALHLGCTESPVCLHEILLLMHGIDGTILIQ